MQKNISVILSTKRETVGLTKVLLGYNTQTYRNFEVIIIFEDKNNEDNSWITTFKKEVFYKMKEVYSNPDSPLLIDDLLNKIETDYIIFANSNSIPRFDFVEHHVKNKEEGFFLAGTNNSISKDVFDKINQQEIYSGNCFELSWLKENGYKKNFLDKFRYSKGLLGAFLNFFFLFNIKFNSLNTSIWKKDLIYKKQYFDDVFFQDIAHTLQKNNIKGKQIKYTTVLIGYYFL